MMFRRNRSSTKSTRPTPISLLSTTGFSQHDKTTRLSRWRTLLSLPELSEYIISVDHHKIWRRHIAWSHREGDTLRNAVTSRFASNMVFMSLLLGAEISVLFSPSRPAQFFRQALEESHYSSGYFWAGVFLCISIGLTLSTLLANFTAWAIIGAVSSENSHAVLRSSIGLYAAQLPARMAVLSIYCFIIWVLLFLFELLPFVWAICVVVLILLMVVHIVVVYSSFGRLVIYSKAMRKGEIFEGDEEDSMTSKRLFEELLKRAVEEKEENTPLPLYYRQHSEIREQVTKLMEEQTNHFTDSGIGEENKYTKDIKQSHHLTKILSTSSARKKSDGWVDSSSFQSQSVSHIESEKNDIENMVNGLGSILDESNLKSSLRSLGLNDNGAATHPLKKQDDTNPGQKKKHHRRESSGIVLQRSTPQSPAF